MLRRRALSAVAVSVAAAAAVASGASMAEAATVNPITVGTAPISITKPAAGTGAVIGAGNTKVNLVAPVTATKPVDGAAGLLGSVVAALPKPAATPTGGALTGVTPGIPVTATPVIVTKPTTGTGAVVNAGDANVTVKLPVGSTAGSGESTPRQRYLVTLVNEAKDAQAGDKVTAALKALGAKVVSQSQATSAKAQSYVVETSAVGAQTLSKLPSVSSVAVDVTVK